MAFIEIKNLSYYYPETREAALKNISAVIPEGQFVLVTGLSGSGKSTLLRAIGGVVPGHYRGKYDGAVLIDGKPVAASQRRWVAGKVGMLFQDPESQIIMNRVESEIVFGMENLAVDPRVMRRRAAEICASLNLTPYLQRGIPQLSGGEKQKIAMASILAMQPEILVVDEPTSQLDPCAAEEIFNVLRRLNEENGITVMMVEHRLERCLHLADRFMVMENGALVCDTSDSSEIAGWAQRYQPMLLPPVPRLFAEAGFASVPMTVKQGRKQMASIITSKLSASSPLLIKNSESRKGETLLQLDKVCFTYPDGTEVLKQISLEIARGSFTAVIGSNGAGKTTLLKTINGLLRPGRGRIFLGGEETARHSVEQLAQTVGYLSQYPGDYLFLPTVREELEFTAANLELEEQVDIDAVIRKFDLLPFAGENPRDLSAGERQRVALASVLISSPALILLDEPTRGLDYRYKEELGRMLVALQQEGTTLLIVSHDMEFISEYAENIVWISEGEILTHANKYEVLGGGTYYSPQMARLFKRFGDGVLTFADARNALSRLADEDSNEAVSHP